MKIYCIAIFLNLSIIIAAQPDKLSFYHISSSDGLPFENSYYSIVQDHEGFIWLASDNGLHKYNGYEFLSYYNDQEDSTSIKGRSIRCLLEDSDKNLWISCIGGLNIYNRIQDNFTQVPVYKEGNLIYNFDARSIIETPDKQIYLAISYDGICKYDAEKKYFKIIPFNIPEKNLNYFHYINTVYVDDENYLWFSTDKYGLFRLDQKTGMYIRFSPESKYFLSSNITYSFIQDSKGFIWVATDDGLNKINTEYLTTTAYHNAPDDEHSISYDIIWRAYEDPIGNLWICTDGGGLNLYNRKDDNFTHFRHDKEAVNSISGDKINGIFLDNQDNLYVNTVGHGFSIANLKESGFFKVYIHSSESKRSLGYNVINAFAEDSKGNIWIGTDGGGLDFHNTDQDIFLHYTANTDNPKSLQTNTIVSLHIDRDENLWVGTYKGGLSRFNREEQTFKTYFHDPKNPNSISNNDIRGIIDDIDGNLILATCGGGVCLLDREKETFTSIQSDFSNENSLCDNYCQSIYMDSDGFIWIGTYYGLSKWDRKNNRFTTFLHDPEDSTTINDYIIYAIHEDKEKNLWFGTISGLNCFNKENQNFSLIENSNYAVFGIQEDKNGNLWLSTEKGLKIYDIRTKKIESFNSNYGFQGQSFRPGANLKTKDGQMIFGGNKGYITFRPDNIRKSDLIPPVYITEVLTNSSISHSLLPLKKNFSKVKEIKMDYDQSFITIKYTALDYYSANHVKYAYMLENFDKDWHYVGKQRMATYSNLYPGTYIFKIRATDGNNHWINETSLQIKILPPWWDTLIAKISFILVILIIGSTIYYVRIYSLKKQKLVLDKLVKKRTREIEKINYELVKTNSTKDKLFSIIAHDLKNPFANVLGFSELLYTRYHKLSEEKKILQIKLLNESAEKIYNLLENLLSWSRSQSGRLNYQPEQLFLKEIIKSNIELLSTLINSKGLNIIVEIPEDIKIFADKNMINTVVRNLLSNAIKFSKQGRISVYAMRDNGNVIIKIKDEGVGIPEEQLKNIFDIADKTSTPGTDGESGTGLGLIICKEFIEHNMGSISVKSEVNKGSEFTIKIPVHSSS